MAPLESNSLAWEQGKAEEFKPQCGASLGSVWRPSSSSRLAVVGTHTSSICTEITRTKDARGFPESKVAVKEGGTVAGNARRELEK